jgi:hypothetical protein
MGIEPAFLTRRNIRRKRHFDETPKDATIAAQSIEESIRVNYFLPIVDQAITSLTRRFEQYKGYENIFGFLFTLNKLRSLDDKRLMFSCRHLETALKSGEDSDIDDKDLYLELKFLQDFIPIEERGHVAILKFLKQMRYFPNALIAYRILLTISVTVASTERSFSKLKLLVIFAQHYDTRKA